MNAFPAMRLSTREANSAAAIGLLTVALLLLCAWPTEAGQGTLSAPVNVDEPPACAPPQPGFLTLDTAPWTTVYVDGIYVGSTPLFKHRLAPGDHTLTLKNEGRAVESHEDVTIEAGRARKLKVLLVSDEVPLDASSDTPINSDDCAIADHEAARFSAETQPWSKVFVDGRLVGSTPLFEHRIKAGAHVARFENEKGARAFVRFNAAVGETVKLSVGLASR